MFESLRTHLKKHGWKDKYLDRDHMHARIGLTNITGIGLISCIEPYSGFQRMFSDKSVLIKKIFTEGMKVKFLSSLKHEIISKPGIFTLLRHPIGAIFEFIRWMYELFSGKRVPDISVIEMCLDSNYGTKSVDDFPFDTTLTVFRVDERSVIFEDSNNEYYILSSVIFSCVTQIEVKIETR